MPNNKVFRELIQWFKAIIIAIILVLLMNIYVVQVYKVEGPSMVPTLHDQQYILLSKLDQTFNYEDIVIIDPRVNRERSVRDSFLDNPFLAGLTEGYWIKRVIGKPHDLLEFKEGNLFRNGTLLTEYYLNETMNNVPNAQIVVPGDSLFVMGDNRNHSLDSRFIGPVPLTHVLGIVMFH
jgi:signal peptidase I